jgi:hypothetical protein
MKTRVKALLVTTVSAAAAAVLALSVGLGGARSAGAEHPEGLAPARPDTVTISTAALDGLEQRVSYLEGIVASLTLASQHIRTYQLCVSGDSGPETCITKPQLDALLANQAHVASVSTEIPKPEPESTGSISTTAAPAGAE